MAVTPYLKLQKPPFDTIPWDAAINGNMDILDAYISRYMSAPNFAGAWTNSTNYGAGQSVLDTSDSFIYAAQITHTSAASPTTFAQDRVAHPTYWTQLPIGSPGAGYAPLVSPVFTGDPTAPTPALSDSDTSIATTAFVRTGVTDGGNAAAGVIGEALTATGTSVAHTNGSPTNCCSISLTAGDWDVFGNVQFVSTGAAYTQIIAGSNTTSATLPTSPTGGFAQTSPAGGATLGTTALAIAQHRRALSATTTVYLVGQASFGAGTSAMTGVITARRRR